MSLLSILNTPLNDLPWCISGVTNAWVSLKRLDVFLSMPEIDKGYYLESSNGMIKNKLKNKLNLCNSKVIIENKT